MLVSRAALEQTGLSWTEQLIRLLGRRDADHVHEYLVVGVRQCNGASVLGYCLPCGDVNFGDRRGDGVLGVRSELTRGPGMPNTTVKCLLDVRVVHLPSCKVDAFGPWGRRANLSKDGLNIRQDGQLESASTLGRNGMKKSISSWTVGLRWKMFSHYRVATGHRVLFLLILPPLGYDDKVVGPSTPPPLSLQQLPEDLLLLAGGVTHRDVLLDLILDVQGRQLLD